ncbi:MAG: hypothetical protein AAF740_06295, partial [Bacteroidota bacterium]
KHQIFLVLSVARPMFPTQDEHCSVSIGFELDESTHERIRFLHKIPQIVVNTTCERCGITDCNVRAADPVLYLRRKSRKQKSAALRRLEADKVTD